MGTAIEAGLERLGQLALVACAKAFLLLVPAYAAGIPDVEDRPAMTAPADGAETASRSAFPMEDFLDRLMAAESRGRPNAKNPRSTALGPFQFIESTFLFVVNRHFRSEVAGLSEKKILALRTNMAFSRRAARAYTNDLIAALEDEGLPATTVNVRLAFLVGPAAALRLLKAPPDRPLKAVLSADAIAANPFMAGSTVGKLVRKAAADVNATDATESPGPVQGEVAAFAADVGAEPEPAGTAVARVEPAVAAVVGRSDRTASRNSRAEMATVAAAHDEAAEIPVAPKPTATASAGAAFEIKCEIGLASCRKWIALQERKAAQRVRSAQW